MQDARGNPVGTARSAALDAAERALWRTMSFYGAPLEDLEAAASADPAWALPHLLHAGFLLSLTEPRLVADAGAALDRAEPLLRNAPPRERAHHHALRTLHAGDWHGACAEWEALLNDHPRDALALQWAHLFDFYRGDAANLRHRVERVLPHWNADDPLHPYVLGLQAFGLEESGLYAEAEATGRRALAGAARVPWAIHAVAHVMEMQGRHEEGSAWMLQWRPDWAEGNGFESHLGWHQALFALETLDHRGALDLFDAHMAAPKAEATLQRLDGASLLWRLRLLGADCGARWRDLVNGWDPAETAAGFSAFNDLHAVLALIGADEIGRAEAWAAQAIARAGASSGSNRAMTRTVGAPLMRGMLAFAKGRHTEAIAQMAPVRSHAHRFGGSQAQRDLIDQTLLAAAVLGGNRSAGRALLQDRVRTRPLTPLTAHWAGRLASLGA